MMKCSNCGFRIDEDALYCPNCGNLLDEVPEVPEMPEIPEEPVDNSYDPYEPVREPWTDVRATNTAVRDDVLQNASQYSAKRDRVAAEEKAEEKKYLMRNIILIAAAVIIILATAIAGVLIFKGHSRDQESSTSEFGASVAETAPMTEEEAKEVVEEYFQCYAVKTGEVKSTLVFDCYANYNKQTGEYADLLGKVQIDTETNMMTVMQGFEDVAGEGSSVVNPSIDPPAAGTDAGTTPQGETSDSGSGSSTSVSSTKYVYNVDYAICLWKDYNNLKYERANYHCLVLVGEPVGFIENVSGTKYAKVSYDNYIGYINKDYLSDSKPNIDNTVKYTRYVNTDGASFRNGPTENYDSVFTLNLNAEVGYIRDMVDNPDYAKVKYNGVIGYMYKGYLSAEKINNTVKSYKYVANVDYAANLYTGTDAQSVICMVLLGEKVGFIENVSGTNYAKVNYSGYIGYMNKAYLSDSKPYIDTTVKRNMYVTEDLVAFRAAPTPAAKIMKTLAKGTTVGYIMNMQYASEYAKVNYNGTIGYVLYSKLSDTAPATPTAAPTPTPSAEPTPTPSAEPTPTPEPDPIPASIIGLRASSTLRDEYRVDNLNDGSTSTMWVTDGGSSEYIEITVPAGATIEEITIYPGDCSSEENFNLHGCPAELKLDIDGDTETLDLFAESADYNSCRNGVTFFIGEISSSGTIRLTITNVRSGNGSNDTAISEIKVR